MNYRHAFHAGNHADVLKHLTVVGLLQALTQKDTPLFAADTHAGRGLYSMVSSSAQKTGEAEDGIGRLLAEAPSDPLIHDYLQVVRNARQQTGDMTVYPGSPWLLSHLTRPQDRLGFVELHDEEAAVLQSNFAGDRRVTVRHGDGYTAMRALLPPRIGTERINRGLVLIDPPFEKQLGEFDDIIAALRDALERWPLGCFAVWYPIKLQRSLQPFMRRCEALPARNVLLAELLVRAADSPLRMNGSGMVIVNAPWQLDTRLRTALAKLAPILADGPGADSLVSWVRQPA